MGIAFLVLAPVALTIGIALLVRRSFPNWSIPRISVLSALPLPAITMVMCTLLFVMAATSSKEACGVDACGMTMAASLYMIGLAVGVYAASVVVAAIILVSGRR